MTRKKLGLFAVAAFLLAAMYFAAFGGYEARREPPKPTGEAVVLPAAPAAPKAEKAVRPAEPVGEKPAERMELAPAARTRPADSSDLAAGVSYSLKKESDKEILPGVTINSGNRSLSIQLPKKDEAIQMRRGSDYGNCDYQMLWQKKY